MTSYVAILPDTEFLVHESTPNSEISRFAFSDTRPTFGFLSYNYGLILLQIALQTSSAFPLGHLKKYKALMSHDTVNDKLEIATTDPSLKRQILDIIVSNVKHRSIDKPIERGHTAVTASLSREQYIDRVRQAIDYIRAGDIYQICLSIKYSVPMNEPPALESAINLFRDYPASHYAIFGSDGYQLLSTSPECFLRVCDGRVSSRPIKGTLNFDNYDETLVSRLQTSPKEDAELSMIVDLIRNDISRNCEYGSVQVTEHKSVFRVDNLLQMYSTVEGQLRPESTCIDLLLDAFPGGSVTGCPKRRAMELIAELEPHSRDIYCGSFFVIKDPRTMDSSIAIRTGYFDSASSTFNFFAGSGIVVESDPGAEYDETVAKAAKFMQLLGK